jgi:hypothetical protein
MNAESFGCAGGCAGDEEVWMIAMKVFGAQVKMLCGR